VETIVATGWWMYDGVAPVPVRVVELDYDFWYAVDAADRRLEPGESPQLNAHGRLYYLRHAPGWPDGDRGFWPDSEGFQTLEEAVAAAAAVVPGPITWQ
jgi:hypothetical protein